MPQLENFRAEEMFEFADPAQRPDYDVVVWVVLGKAAELEKVIIVSREDYGILQKDPDATVDRWVVPWNIFVKKVES